MSKYLLSIAAVVVICMSGMEAAPPKLGMDPEGKQLPAQVMQGKKLQNAGGPMAKPPEWIVTIPCQACGWHGTFILDGNTAIASYKWGGGMNEKTYVDYMVYVCPIAVGQDICFYYVSADQQFALAVSNPMNGRHRVFYSQNGGVNWREWPGTARVRKIDSVTRPKNAPKPGKVKEPEPENIDAIK